LFLLSYYCSVGTLWHLHKFLQHIIVEVTASIIPFYTSSHSWNSMNRSHLHWLFLR
jgi:hypothetical protein